MHTVSGIYSEMIFSLNLYTGSLQSLNNAKMIQTIN